MCRLFKCHLMVCFRKAFLMCGNYLLTKKLLSSCISSNWSTCISNGNQKRRTHSVVVCFSSRQYNVLQVTSKALFVLALCCVVFIAVQSSPLVIPRPRLRTRRSHCFSKLDNIKIKFFTEHIHTQLFLFLFGINSKAAELLPSSVHLH